MPMDSMQIAAMTGSFNQHVMMGMQHSAMISQQYGGYAPMPGYQPVPTQGEQFAGMLGDVAGSWGMGAMANPRLNNFGGGVLQPLTMTGQHMVGQAMYGMHQQQMLDASMRQSYRFQNQFGGRGFTGAETAGMGQDLRALAMQRGPGGQQTTFEELGRLASNMGRMGMAEGVRSVKDFNEKFKQMLTTVKTIATELGTSLEEAQKVMASMKGSGVFRNQGQFAAQIRAGATAGGLATSELSGMALIGSQISRSVGGLGSAGARAGVEAITNIGAARKAGVVSEEDIYNVTGLTGAEGRRAFAQMNLASDAQFFRGGIGRRALAAMAGRNGQLDMEDVEAFMAGGVGTGETMQRAYQNLGQVGRANFIRNEGRLRGEAMAQFGGLGKAIVARNWLEERGMNLNEMNDRNMLFFQRKFRVGRDEADQIVKMARNLDTIMAERQQATENDNYARMLEESQRAQSPQELIKRAQMGRQAFNDQVRQYGASLYRGFGTQIGELLQAGTGGFQDRRRADLSREISTLYRGGGAAQDIVRQLGVPEMTANEQRRYDELFGAEMGTLQGAQFERFMGGQGARLREMGVDPRQIRTAGDYQNMQRRLHRMQLGAMGGGSEYFAGRAGGLAADPAEARRQLQSSLDDATRTQLRGDIAATGVQGRNDEFLRNLGKSLERLNTEQGKELAKAFRQANDEERARMATDVLKAIGMEGLGTGRFGGKVTQMPLGGGRFATRERELLEVGRGLTGGLAGFGGQGPGYAEEAGLFVEDLQRIAGGTKTAAGRFLGAKEPGDTSQNILERGLAWAKGAEQSIKASRETIASELTPTGALSFLGRKGGEGLDWVTGGRTRGWAQRLVGEGGITGKGGLIERFRGTALGKAVDEPFSDATRELLGGAGGAESTMAAEYLRSTEGRAWQQQVIGGDETTRRNARLEMENRRAELASRKRTMAEQAEFRALQGIEAQAALRDLPKDASLADRAAAGRRIYGAEMEGKTDEEVAEIVSNAAGTVGADWNMQQQVRIAQDMAGVGARARADQIRAERRQPDIDKLKEEGKISAGTADIMARLKERRHTLAQFTGQKGELEKYRQTQNVMAGIEEKFAGMTIQEKQQAAKELAMAGETSVASMARREASIEKRLARSGAVGSEREARDIAGMLGVDFRKGELGAAGTAGGRAEMIAQRMGLGTLSAGRGAALEKQLQQILSGKVTEVDEETGETTTRKLSRGERAQRLRQFQEKGEVQEARRNQQDESAKQNDPSYRALSKISDAMGKVQSNTENLKGAIRGIGTDIVEAIDKKSVGEGKKE